MRKDQKRINILIDSEILKRAAKYKLKEGRAIGWQMNKGLEIFLDKEEPKDK